MKKKVIGILVILLIIIGGIFSISAYAGTGKLYTNLAALNPSGVGYGIGDPTNKGKYIWHMSTYNSISGGLSEVQKNIYCLKGDYGVSWETFFNTSPILEYNLVFDLQGERQQLLNKIVDNENDADEVIQSLLDVNGNQYREVLWLLDNMFIKGENNKEDYLAKAGILKDEYQGVVEYYNANTNKIYGEEVLTDDDIIAIQRVAIWTFTNGGDFDKTQNENWLRITTDGTTYSLLGDSRNAMAGDLYNYLVSSAKTGASLYTAQNNYTVNDAPVSVNVDGLTKENGKYKIDAKSSASNYIIGPIVMEKNNDFLYKISMTVKNEKNEEIVSSQYSLTDANGTSLGENVTLKDLVNRTEGFYIKIDKSLATKFNIQVNVIHYNTTKNLWLQGTETTNEVKLNAEQPIAEFSREEKTTTMEFWAGIELVNVPVTKVWEDGNNQDRIRPNSIEVNLKNGNTIVDTVTLSEDNNWTHTFTNLPKKSDDVLINYTIEETGVPTNYISEITGDMTTGYTITNKYTPKKPFDLALRKYITKINNTELTALGLETRVPEIKTETIETNKTATYNHKKDPIKVEENDIVTYEITIYNEGEKPGYASQIIDQLPTGLIYMPSGTITSKDSSGADKNQYVVTYESVTNKVTFDIVNSEENPAKELQPYEENKLDSETIEIKCKVIYRAKAGSNNILTNVAWINEEYDAEDNKTITTKVGDDRDSEPRNAPKVSKDNMENYKGNTENPDDLSNSEYFYEGQQDDDDFEKLYVKTFDLSLRKFITLVNGKELEESREPEVDVTPLQEGTGTTAIYNHPKTPVALNNGDTVIYTIRVYNEGEIAGFASEVKDHLPPYLQYVENSTVNSKYKWNISEDGRIATTTYLSDKEISEFDGTELDYEDIQIECKISTDAVPYERITNIAEISEYKYGDKVYAEDVDSKSDNIDQNLPEDKDLPDYKKNEENNQYVPGNEDDDDFEKVYVKKFDLALRKFITQVQEREITSRIPQVKNENGVISYEHPKDPITVHVGDVVIYTLRIYNEGEIDGYASEITDDIPEYLEYLPEDSTNVEYKWKMYDKNGNETQNIEEAVKVKTTYLSKDNGTNNLLVAFDGNIIYYRDIKIAFKVKDPNSNTYIITNHAQISDDTDKDGNEINDKDSYTDEWNEGEDDQDIENVKVEYFDLSILKFVSKVIVQENGKETITETGYNGHEDPEPVVKVELHKKKLDKVTVKFGFGITVTNEGDVPGAATEITDYVPEGLKFDGADNPKWTDEGNNVVSTTQLKDVILQPGESKTIEIILTWINDRNNMALKTNTVEISKDENEYDVPDKDSIPDNQKDGEDDIDIAKVILAVATGRAKTYFTLTLGLLTVIATGVYLIKKFVL